MAYCTNCLNKAAELYTIWPGNTYSVRPLGYSPKTERRTKTLLAWSGPAILFKNGQATKPPRNDQSNCNTSGACGCEENTHCSKLSRTTTPGDKALSFIDIPWTDVVFPRILSHLSWGDLFRLRQVSSESLSMVTEYLTSITSIELGCHVASRMTPLAFSVIARDQLGQRLRVLNLSACKWLSNDQLLPIVEKNCGLEVLDISGCFEVNNSAVRCVALNCKNLRCLRLKDCHWLSAEAINSVAKSCSALEEVDLTSCWEIADESAVELITNCPQLRSMSLSKIYSITDKTPLALAVHSRSLADLNLSGCWRITDYGIRMVGEYCSSLKRIVVGDCRDVTDDGLSILRKRGIEVVIPEHTRAPRNFLSGLELRLQV